MNEFINEFILLLQKKNYFNIIFHTMKLKLFFIISIITIVISLSRDINSSQDITQDFFNQTSVDKLISADFSNLP